MNPTRENGCVCRFPSGKLDDGTIQPTVEENRALNESIAQTLDKLWNEPPPTFHGMVDSRVAKSETGCPVHPRDDTCRVVHFVDQWTEKRGFPEGCDCNFCQPTIHGGEE